MTAFAQHFRRLPWHNVPRRHVVWASLLASMTVVGGVLLLLDRTPLGANPAIAMVGVDHTAKVANLDAIFSTQTPVQPGHWSGIVVHHSGKAIGSAESITRDHNARGYKGLGYHFVISNGQGAPDGQIFVGYRWQEQLPGVHVVGPKAEQFNRQTIGICLIGDGERREFTEVQMARVAELVGAIQAKLGIADRNVVLHRDIAPTSGPGRLFPEVTFRQLLADARR